MGLGAAVAGVTAVVGAGAQMYTGAKAAKAQEKAAAASDATQRYFYDTTRADYAPYREAGYAGLDKLQMLYGMKPGGASMIDQIKETPGYQFRLDQGIDAVKKNMSSRGLLGSTATSKMMDRYAEGLAASEYDAYANRLAAMAGIGQTATGSTAAAGANAAQGISQAQMAAGNARASSYANTGSAINNGLQNVASAYLYGQNGGFGGGGAYGISGSDGIY